MTTAENEIREMVTRFLRAFERRDLAAASELFARDDAFLFYGTQVNLHFTGWPGFEASLRRQFETLEDVRLDLDPGTLVIRVLAGGSAACVGAQSLGFKATIGGRVIDTLNIRITCTLERRDDRWVFVQMHWSLPDGEILVKLEGGTKYW
jgi:uncharacterized protein (TIGR02246 family)